MDTIEKPYGQTPRGLQVFSGYTGGKLSWWQKKARTMAGK